MKKRFVPVRGLCFYLTGLLFTGSCIAQLFRETLNSVSGFGILCIFPFILLFLQFIFSFCIITVGEEGLSIFYPFRIFLNNPDYPFAAIASIDLSLVDHRKGGRGRYLSILLTESYGRNALFGDEYVANHRHMFWRKEQLEIAAELKRFAVNAGPEEYRI